VAAKNGIEIPVADQFGASYDAWGTDRTYPAMAAGWAWAFATPYSWTGEIASHFGGTRNGLAISWPKAITDAGGIRNQFHHVIDIVPTILEVSGIKAPATVDGRAQKPIEGVGMAYAFDKAHAGAPTKRHAQYFEAFGDRAMYEDGWIASTKVVGPPWDALRPVRQDPAKREPWELYDLGKDWTQSADAAAKYSDKLAGLMRLFWSEAEKYRVLPLDASVAARLVALRPSSSVGRKDFTWSHQVTGIPNGDAPFILDSSYTFAADGAEGMIVTQGGRFGGYGFYLLKGKPVFAWNLLGLKRVRWEAPAASPPGKHRLGFDFKYDGHGIATLAFDNLGGIGRPGTGVLKVDGKVVATRRMERTIPLTLPWDETFDIGADTGTPVDDRDYQVRFDSSARSTSWRSRSRRPS
jgi:arylsulfatase